MKAMRKQRKKSGKTKYYEVDEIIDKRVVDGSVQYFLSWKGFDETHNSWEPEDNLLKQTLAQFNGLQSNRCDFKDFADESVVRVDKSKLITDKKRLENWWTPFQIIDLQLYNDNEKIFLMLWKNRRENDWIVADVAKKCFPNFVIQYYQSLITFDA